MEANKERIGNLQRKEGNSVEGWRDSNQSLKDINRCRARQEVVVGSKSQKDSSILGEDQRAEQVDHQAKPCPQKEALDPNYKKLSLQYWILALLVALLFLQGLQLFHSFTSSSRVKADLSSSIGGSRSTPNFQAASKANQSPNTPTGKTTKSKVTNASIRKIVNQSVKKEVKKIIKGENQNLLKEIEKLIKNSNQGGGGDQICQFPKEIKEKLVNLQNSLNKISGSVSTLKTDVNQVESNLTEEIEENSQKMDG